MLWTAAGCCVTIRYLTTCPAPAAGAERSRGYGAHLPHSGSCPSRGGFDYRRDRCPGSKPAGRQGGFAQSGPSATIPANRELEEDYFPQVSHTPLRLSEVEAELADLTDGSAMLQEAERLLGLTGDAANAPEVAAGYAALLEQYALADES